MKAIQVEDYKPILAESYATDQDLIEKWHIEAGQGLEKCIEREFKDLVDANVKVFSVTKSEKLIGYFGRELFNSEQYLTSFFVKPEFRKREYISEFWSLLLNEF